MLQKQIGETVAKGLVEFVNPYRLPKFKKPIGTQMREIEGLQEFNKGLYHNQHYEKLIQNITRTRAQFRAEQSEVNRRTIATEEYQYWRDYVKVRAQELPEGHQINDKMVADLKQSFDVACDRHNTEIPVERLPKMHYDHSRLFHFTIPVENRCLLQMFHHHMGYLLRLDFPLSFEKLMRIYELKVLATYEKSIGQTLLGQEIQSIAYWELFDQKHQGYMDFPHFSQFAGIFSFDVEPDLTSIRKEFGFAANLFQGELHKNSEIIRFDFYRHIFLERNL